MHVYFVTLWGRYGYDHEVHGALGVYETKEKAEAFVASIKELWDVFQESWDQESNYWGRRFYLSGNPSDLAETEIYVEEWEVL